MALVRALAVSLFLLRAPAPLIAQEMTSAETQMVQTALDRGRLLYAYDQAAWHGTDAMLADAEKRGLTSTLAQMIGGWIVAGSASDPKVIFFDKDERDPGAVFVIQLADGGRRVLSTDFVGEGADDRIDEATRSLIRARGVASSLIAEGELTRCARGNWNIAVLPPDAPGGPTLVYILSPQDTLDAVPFGGHYRIEVSADGTAGPVHAFTRSCIAFPTRVSEEKPEALVVTQLLDPVPTEISVFTMLAAGTPLYIMTTTNSRSWFVGSEEGRPLIRLVGDMPGSAMLAREKE